MKPPAARPRHREAGWCLSLRYFAGAGIEVERAEPLPPDLKGQPWLYCGDELLAAADWRALVADWRDAVDVLALFVSDCRLTALPGARVDRAGLRAALDAPGWELVEDDVVENRAFLVYRRLADAAAPFVARPWRKRDRHCLVIRGGAFGDALMAASVLPALKADGWAIDFAGNQNGAEVLRHDPHIDEFVLVRDGQVNDGNLGAYWAALGRRYDRVVNLSYTVEHTLLKRPWDGAYFWPDETRRRMCAGSYLANTHAIAAVPGPFRVAFHPSAEESSAAAALAARLGPFALWALRGSAVHKWYPYAPQLAVRMLAETGLALVLSGGPDAADLESRVLDTVIEMLGPAAARRVHSMVGTGPIRRVLALAQRAALVIGPETGVLNAVGQMAMPKVCFLSHSSPSNLTDDWVNAHAVHADASAAPCWPCHRLHYGHEHCPREPRTGAALCQASISPESAMAVVRRALAALSPAEADASCAS